MPQIAASVSTFVVSWKEAAEMNDSVESDAFVMPRSSGSHVDGRLPSSTIGAVRGLDLHLVDVLAHQELACRRRP